MARLAELKLGFSEAGRTTTMWHVYILKSLKDQRTYTGSTNDIDRRLKEHNNGKVTATKNRKPFVIIHTEVFQTEQEARQREQWYKSGAGRRALKKIFSEIV